MITGFTCGAFDLFHAGHVAMLEEARERCDYLLVGLQSDPSIDRPDKNKPIESIVERQIKLRGCRFVNEIIVYDTEKDLEDILAIKPINIRFIGEDHRDKVSTGLEICKKRGIEIYYTTRQHSFSSSGLRERIKNGNNTNTA